jgi:tryptophan 2,3-dioxygenase
VAFIAYFRTSRESPGMKLSDEIMERLQWLQEKYNTDHQDLSAYLEGLVHAQYLTYWDYINLDALLALQVPRTQIEDEPIFIMYHQITELYFKLTLHELTLLRKAETVSAAALLKRINRINRYFEALTTSFGVMEKGMDRDQFLKFRLTLAPASGFQSAQYRMIEICATPFINLVAKDDRNRFATNASFSEMFDHIYWKAGATLEGTGEKTLTLKQFEEKYTDQLVALAKQVEGKTLGDFFYRLPEADRQDEALINALKLLDLNVNVYWPLQHYRTAVAYLAKRPHDISATGGTNWQKYLPPRFQKRIFYPDLWTEKEREEWGKSWVEDVLNRLKA